MDFLMNFHGSVIMLQPVTNAARAWMVYHNANPDLVWDGSAVPVTSKNLSAVLNSIDLAGLKVHLKQNFLGNALGTDWFPDNITGDDHEC